MPRMIPDQVPSDTVSAAERLVFDRLAGTLSPDHVVIHSLPWLDDSFRFLREGECDFLVLHPEQGMLAIEAKSGNVRYDGSSRCWIRDETGKPIRDPFLQAQDSAKVLARLLGQRVPAWSRVRPPFGHAVAFPQAVSLRGALPPHVSPDILILNPDMNRLPERIQSILAHWGKPSDRFSAEEFEPIVQALLPVFQVASTLPSDLGEQKRQLVRLTRRQGTLLDALERNRRLVIEGCAGSGKTILAMERAIHLDRQGAKVLLVCFNVPLADGIRKLLHSRSADVDVFNFHGLCEHVVLETGGSFDVPDPLSQDFWDFTAPELLEKAVPAFPRRYDALIVDEGQDFCSQWWIVLEKLLADPDRGWFYIFTDPLQNIFQRDNAMPFREPVVELKMNCRNTAQIAALVHRAANLQAEVADAAVDGLPPVVREVHDDAEEREGVRQALHHLITEQGLSPQQVVLLGPRRFEHSAFAGRPLLGNFRIVQGEEPGGPNQVRYATVHRFKGLEADCAFLVGWDAGPKGMPAAIRRNLFYVAASRAKFLLYVFYRPGCDVPRWIAEPSEQRPD